MQINFSIGTDWTGIAAISYNLQFANPSVAQYTRIATWVFSSLIGTILFAFCANLTFDSDTFTQILILILGFAGILGSGIFRVLFSSPMGDSLSLAFFVNMVRFFLLIQLDLLRGNRSIPPTLFVIVFSALFSFYVVVEATANNERQISLDQSEIELTFVVPTEEIAIYLHAAYISISLLFLIIAGLSNTVSGRRLFLLGLSVILTNVVTFITKVYFVVQNCPVSCLMPQQLYISVHIIMAAMAIFFLHSNGNRYQAEYSKPAMDDDMELDIEMKTSDEDEGLGNEEK
jgi:hypothetical protein